MTCSPAKAGDVWSITRGGPGAGLLLPVLLSEGVNAGRISIERVAEVTSTTAAKVLGLYPRKGAIRLGADADLALVDLDRQQTVDPQLLGVGSDYTLYDGISLRGWPVAVTVRGAFVVREGEIVAEPGTGSYLAASRSSAPGAAHHPPGAARALR